MTKNKKPFPNYIKIFTSILFLVFLCISLNVLYYYTTTPSIKKSYSKFCGKLSLEKCEEKEYNSIEEIKMKLTDADFSVYLIGEMSDNFFRDYIEKSNSITEGGVFKGLAFAKDKNTIKNKRWDLSIYQTVDGVFKVITIYENTNIIGK